jgi:hypothetical protein
LKRRLRRFNRRDRHKREPALRAVSGDSKAVCSYQNFS